MHHIKILLIFSALLSSLVSEAKPQLSLVESCAELMNIYSSKNEQRFMAAQTTSLSESLRAGYCLGVLEQYAETEYSCRSDWFKRAEFIAKYNLELESNRLSDRKLLKLSCEI